MALRLLEGAHDSEGAEQVSLWVGGQAGDDGVVGPLAWPQAVGVLWVQNEAVAPVLQREATALRHNSCIPNLMHHLLACLCRIFNQGGQCRSLQ